MTEREAAIKRLVDAGGRWPPKFLPGPPWRGSGRYQRVRCVECGYESRPMTANLFAMRRAVACGQLSRR